MSGFAREAINLSGFFRAREDYMSSTIQNSNGQSILPSELVESVRQPETSKCVVCNGLLAADVRDLFDVRFGIPGRFEARRCTQCGLEQLFPFPTPEGLKALYERYYNFGGEHDTLYTELRDLFFTSPLHRLWAFLDGDISFYTQIGAGRLLDIGCNEGRGLALYARNGYTVEGLELNENAASVARGKGLTVHTVMLEQFTPAAPFDVVVLSNVLEHSLDPAQMLRAVHHILRPAGKIWISCPNSRSWLRSCFGRYWINWHVPFHIVHFSCEALRGLLARSGFESVQIRQITPSLWVASSAIARLFAKAGKANRKLRNPALVFVLMLLIRFLFFPILVLGNLLGRGDCLIAVATNEEVSPIVLFRGSDTRQ